MCQGFLIRSVVHYRVWMCQGYTPNYIQKTFNGPLHVYIPNTHAHERSLREVNLLNSL